MSEQSEHDAKVEEIWHTFLTKGASADEARQQRIFRWLPAHESHVRCHMCYVPFEGVGGSIARVVFNKHQSSYNPHFCNVCDGFARNYKGGAEIELSMLFADVRGSTSLAEGMSPSQFMQLIDRYYNSATDILVDELAYIDKIVGDEVVAFFLPGFAGADHARVAIECAEKLLRATGHADPEGPWVPVGAGVHTGTAFFGAIGSSDGVVNITALGDAVNTGARLASSAAAGEIIVSDDAYEASGLMRENLDRRQLELKGKSDLTNVRVITIGAN